MTNPPALTLNDGRRIPQLGLGVWQVPNATAAALIADAVAAGYRLIDTAAAYGNEDGVGRGIAEVDAPREDLFVTTKLADSDHGYDRALAAFYRSLKRLGLDFVDLYLIHWPLPRLDRYVETWRALIRLKEEGRAKSIGVSNFTPAHIRRLVAETGVIPALNQIELHPRFQQTDSRKIHEELKIATQSWSPLGRGRLDNDPTIARIAHRLHKSCAQTILRWHVESGFVVIPKSISPSRMRENIDVFDFRLEPDDMANIQKLDSQSGRVGPHPDRSDQKSG
jgi:2,5-diketo-D-gluconate reductase A